MNPIRRNDAWMKILLPLGAAILLGAYGYTYRIDIHHQDQFQDLGKRAARIENTVTRILCRVSPADCLREGQHE